MRGLSSRSWWRSLSLRIRILGISVTAVVIVVASGAILLISLLNAELLDTATDLGEDVAEDTVELALAGQLPKDLPRIGSEPPAVQVVRAGQVISQTPDELFPRRAFSSEQVPPGDTRYFTRNRLPIDEDGPFRVVAMGTKTPEGPATVYVAVDVEDAAEAIEVAKEMGGFGLVVLVLVLSVVLWFAIGRTLAPVAAIRARTEAITASELHQRVPEPDGHDEISDLARTINDMLARLEGSARRQEAFVADAAHELRSPIASLQARLQTMLLSTETTPNDRDTRDLLRETVRMGRLVDHLLLLARSDAGTMNAARRPVDLDEVVLESMATIETQVSINLAGVQPVQVKGQSDLLEHVVRNLLENAERYAEDSIEVSLQTEGDNAVLTVDDDGPGIPEDRRDDVIIRFVRVDASRDRGTGGTGLGLSIVHEIVGLHGGELLIGDSPLGGARLQVVLPLADERPVTGE